MLGSSRARFKQYLDWACIVPTPQVRGLCCCLAERAQLEAIIRKHTDEEDIPHDALWLFAYELGLASHLAMDCPKKYEADEVLNLCRNMLEDLGLDNEAERSTSYAAKHWTKVVAPEFSFKDTWLDVEDQLVQALAKEFSHEVCASKKRKRKLGHLSTDVPLGMVWVEQERTVLGFQAGQKIAAYMVNRPHVVSYAQRDKSRSQLQEIAYLLMHCLRRKVVPNSNSLATPAGILRGLRVDAESLLAWVAPDINAPYSAKNPRRCFITDLMTLWKTLLH